MELFGAISIIITESAFGTGMRCSTVGNLFLLTLFIAENKNWFFDKVKLKYYSPGMNLYFSIVCGNDLCLGKVILIPGLSKSWRSSGTLILLVLVPVSGGSYIDSTSEGRWFLSDSLQSRIRVSGASLSENIPSGWNETI